MATQRNKIDSIKTLDRVAQELGVDADWLSDIATGMEPEDGVIWVHGSDDHGTLAFSADGIESLRDLIEIQREVDKERLK